MRLHNSWSLLINREFDNFNKQCIADYEEVVAEYKRFHVDTEKDYGIDAATTQKQTHDDSSPFDYDDPLRAYEAFLADELADDINNTAHINVPEYFDIDCDDANVGNESGERRSRRPNQFDYEFGNVFDANWYRKFLHPDVCERTYIESERDRYGQFRTLFRVPLEKVDGLVHLFLDKGWIRYTKHCVNDDQLHVKAQLLMLATLNVLGHHSPFRTLQSNTEISTSEHRAFFHLFINKMYSIKDDYICYPPNMEALNAVMDRYKDVYLPGCGGSIDVVHLKWSACPAGDTNRCKGKEGYPTLAFEVITGYDRQILGVSAVQFGTRNDKHIVKIDENVTSIRDGWYSTVEWEYLDAHGVRRTAVGIYLICDGGYLRWPTLICPYTGRSVASREGYFSAHLESIRKDGEFRRALSVFFIIFMSLSNNISPHNSRVCLWYFEEEMEDP